jgi:phospholipase/lecithinase/hemolysin
MMLKKAALAGASLLCLAHHAHAQNFNQLIAFGDSTTDTGWFANASVGSGPLGPLFDQLVRFSLANGGNAHFTGPGPGNAQILGSFFGLPANPANTPGGTNYAIGGSFNDATLGPGFQNLLTTLALFGPNPNLPGTDAQISNYWRASMATPIPTHSTSSAAAAITPSMRRVRLAQMQPPQMPFF